MNSHSSKKIFDHFPFSPFPPVWASDWGEDEYGFWVAFSYLNVRQGFRWIPPAEFSMGSPAWELKRNSDENQHQVILTKGYWLADTPVTQALWQTIMGSNPSRFKGDKLPVEKVNWHDATRFIQKLNGLQNDMNMRLPTEAEWENACRAGTETPFSFGENIDTDHVNYDGSYPYSGNVEGLFRQTTVNVELLPANSWGLFQMHGNVWEWCHDWYSEYTNAAEDPTGPEKGESRVLRGGSWINDAHDARSARRYACVPDNADFIGSTGFRLARS